MRIISLLKYYKNKPPLQFNNKLRAMNRGSLKKHYKNKDLLRFSRTKIKFKKSPYRFLRRANKKKSFQVLKTVSDGNIGKFIKNKKIVCGLVCGVIFIIYVGVSLIYSFRFENILELPDTLERCPAGIKIKDVKEVVFPDERGWFNQNQNKILIGLGVIAVGTVIKLLHSYMGGGDISISPPGTPNDLDDLLPGEDSSDKFDIERYLGALKIILDVTGHSFSMADFYSYNNCLQALYIFYKAW